MRSHTRPSITLFILLTACRPAPHRPATAEGLTPWEARLTAFQTGLARPAELGGGTPSRDSLVSLVVHGIERRDTALLRRLEVTKEEFAWLIYPTSAQGRPPYDLEPQAYWEMLFFHSDGGLTKALEAYGGSPLGVTGYSCDTTEVREGINRLVGSCLLERHNAAGQAVQEALFGVVIERNGVWKVLSYANKLD
jgi:hypothetical protein